MTTPMTPTAIDLEGLRALVLGRLQRDGSITREDIDEIFSGMTSEQDARIARATEGVVLTARLAAADPQIRNRLPRSVREAVGNLNRALDAPPAAAVERAPHGDAGGGGCTCDAASGEICAWCARGGR